MGLNSEPASAAHHPAATPTGGEPILPSRDQALGRLRAGLESGRGPLLVTGAAGVGKTWLSRRLGTVLPADWRWLGVDLSPATAPVDCYTAIGHGLGLTDSEGPGASRRQVEDFLAESAADGLRWVFVLDEAQSVPPAVLDELRIVANRLGQADGLGGMLLVGQTALARRIETHPLRALATRLTARVHLRPLDVEEARQLVEQVAPGLTADEGRFEARHRDAGGNPQRLLEWARAATRPVAPARPARPATAPTPTAPAPIPAPPSNGWETPLTGVSRPPIEVEDGVVEVGWEPPSHAAPADFDRTGSSHPASEESIHDHYAALQAWNEWARNQGRGTASRDLAPAGRAALDVTDPEDLDESAPRPLDHAVVRLEGEHDFAPYSQLFSRLREANDAK